MKILTWARLWPERRYGAFKVLQKIRAFSWLLSSILPADGAAEGGRDYDAAYISEERLQNLYLPPFRAGVDAGAATVMSAYMDLNDVSASGNLHLLQEILRTQLNFKGFVVSDAFAVGSLVTQGFAKNATDAALRGATAGVNMDMGSATYLEQMKALIDKGQLSASQLDDLVRPILAAKYHLGLFEHPTRTAPARPTPKCWRSIVRQRESRPRAPLFCFATKALFFRWRSLQSVSQ